MDGVTHPLTLKAAEPDLREQSIRQAHHCVRFAIVTSEDVAAKLIDKAIRLHAICDQQSSTMAA
jgi:hypothetical protein